MRLLLDTHVWLWWIASPERLGPGTMKLLQSGEPDVFFSAASGWEIAIKYALGKMTLPDTPDRFIPPRLERDALKPLNILLRHTLIAGALPPHHQDPIDRLLIAQAQVENLALVTADPAMKLYDGLHLQWATE
jgi:PIN domain nuclease of toxin-antitoxin system